MREFHKDEGGLAIVEATILLPVCMIMVIALYYAAIFMCQKANLQANLQNALIYYKNVESDTYMEAFDKMACVSADGMVSAEGSSYGRPAYLFPYRFFGMSFDSASFESFFKSMCGNMFFDDGSNVQLTANETNYVVYKAITATAVQTVKPAVSLAMVGVDDEMTISVMGTVVVSDADEFIRNTDFVIDIVEDTAFGEAAGSLVDKATDFYNRFKEKFHIE